MSDPPPRDRHHTRNRSARWRALADPWKIIHIDPTIVRYATVNPRGFEAGKPDKPWRDMGAIVSGDWDIEPRATPYAASIITRAVEQRYVQGHSWKDTGMIDRKVAEVAARGGGPVDGCVSRDDFIARYEQLDQVYASMRTEGYVMRSEVDPEQWRNDVFVAIGRAGQFLFVRGQGTHRLALARLTVGSIPVRVLFRHERWQRRRELGRLLSSHPDLADLPRIPVRFTRPVTRQAPPPS